MNNREKLVETTVKYLKNNLLNEDVNTDIKEYYRQFNNKVKSIVQQLTKSATIKPKRTKDIITIEIEQRYLIDRIDCQNYIQKQAKIPFTHRVEYDINKETDEYISNEEFDNAIDYVDNKYIPTLKNYMDSHNKECIDLIQKTFENNNIVVKDIDDNSEITHSYDKYKYIYIADIIAHILRGWENPYELYPYQHKYTVTIDINDNMNTDVTDGEYKVSYNPNYQEYTIRSKKSGRVYFATTDPNEAYAELDRLNNGGSRGPELHKQDTITMYDFPNL